MLDETEAAPGATAGETGAAETRAGETRAGETGAAETRAGEAAAADTGAGATAVDAADAGADDALLSRLRLIEERPLDERADAYTRIHSELVEVLEGQDDQRQDD